MLTKSEEWWIEITQPVGDGLCLDIVLLFVTQQTRMRARRTERLILSSTGSLYIVRVQCATYSFLLKENADCLHNVGTCNEREAAGFAVFSSFAVLTWMRIIRHVPHTVNTITEQIQMLTEKCLNILFKSVLHCNETTTDMNPTANKLQCVCTIQLMSFAHVSLPSIPWYPPCL